jgi:hypothetical protein
VMMKLHDALLCISRETGVKEVFNTLGVFAT